MIGIHHALRLLFLPCLALTLTCTAQGPYTALLSNGDTLRGKEYFLKGDTLGFRGGARVAARDVALFWSPKERWTFTYPAGRMKKVLEEGSRPCTLGRITALRCADHPIAFDSLPVPPHWRSEPQFLACYLADLKDRGTTAAQNGDRSAVIVPRADHMIFLRNGDSLAVETTFYSKPDSLCWMGGGRMHKDRVFWVRTKDRLLLMVDRSNSLVPVPAGSDLQSACGKGKLLTRIYERSPRPDSLILRTNQELLTDPAVVQCFTPPTRKNVRPGTGTYTDTSKSVFTDHAQKGFRSYLSTSAGMGALHGGWGLHTVIGPNGTGLSFGAGGMGAPFYSVGAQLAVKRIFYVNASYGTLEVGAFGAGNVERTYRTNGYILGAGFMFGPTKVPRIFLQVGMAYSGGASRPSPFGVREKIGGASAAFALGYRF